jgi:hypothetical protein
MIKVGEGCVGVSSSVGERTIAQVMADITTRRNLDPKRDRDYPRVVTRSRHNHYRVTTSTDGRTHHDHPPTTRIATTTRPTLINSSSVALPVRWSYQTMGCRWRTDTGREIRPLPSVFV